MTKSLKVKPFNKVEWELIKADIAFLKAEAESKGDMEKWRKLQKKFEKNMYKSNRELYEFMRYSEKEIENLLGPDPRTNKPKST